jgi:hypothetical protein
VEEFYQEISPKLCDFVLYGSGDFHFLTALWLRRLRQSITLICFDNHPDWDVRPPYWGCGGWVNRALELPQVKRASIWGCGNFELAFPARLFANHRALRSGRLEVHGWTERQNRQTQKRFPCMNRKNWRESFSQFANALSEESIYITIDLDCIREEEAVTNWENGLFTVEDLVWALGELHQNTKVIGGDLCGGFSKPVYARGKQRLVAQWDHPKQDFIDEGVARQKNLRTLDSLWPVLTHGNDRNTYSHQADANPSLNG